MIWNKEKDKYLTSLINNHGTKWKLIAEKMTEQFNEVFKNEQVRGRWRTELKYKKPEIDPEEQFGVKFKRLTDGSEVLEKLVDIPKGYEKDFDYILKAFGYDPEVWEIRDHELSIWEHHNKVDGTKTLRAGKIKVSPKTNGFNFKELLNSIKDIPQIKIDTYIPDAETYLNIPLADMHFGVTDYEYYKETQKKVAYHIRKKHKEILFIIGNDLLHNNDHRGRTASGREIQHFDMTKAWEEARKFYYPLLEEALTHSNKVKVMYIKGNHSESLEWCFIQMLKERFPQIEFDDEFKERKVHMLGLNFVGANHGDKKTIKKLPENFATEFPAEWSIANTRTVFTGHLHHEKVIDNGGIVSRQLPTGVDVDNFHEDHGYTTAHKRFQIHEYTYEGEEGFYYV